MTEQLLLTADQVGELLAISRAEAYRLVQRSDVRAVRIGRLVRIPRAEVEAYVERLQLEAGFEPAPLKVAEHA